MALSEADTYRKLVVPKLQAAGWDDWPHSGAANGWHFWSYRKDKEWVKLAELHRYPTELAGYDRLFC